MNWYTQTLDQVFERLSTSREGLGSQAAQKLLKQYGRNELLLRKDPWWKVVIEPFRNVFVAVLATAGIISIISGEYIEAGIVLVIIGINASIFYTQQYATNRVLRALERRRTSKVAVVRNTQQQMVSAELLVPGDVVLLSEGERVPADARIIEETNLQVDESSLTGESIAVHKLASTLSSSKEIYEQHNMLFQGTYIITGTCRAVVVCTGLETEFGQIAKLATNEKDESPLQVKINRLITIMVRTIGIIVVLVFLLALVRDIPAHEALRFVLSMSVSAVPEGLPVALIVIFVLGMRRLAKYQVLVRSFKAIEDIGLVTTIATDKTGTLTKNHLTVVDSWTHTNERMPDIAARTLDVRAKLSDPLDRAIEEASRERVHVGRVYPFDITLRMSGAFNARDKKIYIKGSPEHIIARSRISKKLRHDAESAMHELASKGYRVIALASVPAPNALSDLSSVGTLDFIGLVAFADELRPEAKVAIRRAMRAGISVRLITGDHFETAYNIAKTLGIAKSPDQVVEGYNLPKNIAERATLVSQKYVFARILPEDKYRILEGLKQTDIVAMTGDGVNDVPAIANAHVGVAMGSGSDIARDAGGIILLDDNFSSIVRAIGEGRRIYDNVRRMLFYLLSTTIGELSTMIGALLLGLPLPVTAIQILWINLVTDTAMVLPLGLEPEEKGHMLRPPREPNAPLLKKFMVVRLVLVALTIAVTNLTIVAILHGEGYSDAYIQSVVLFTIVAAQWMNALNARSETEPFWVRFKVRNTPLLIGFGVAVLLQSLVLFGPLASVFSIQPVHPGIMAASFIFVTVSILAVVELHKLLMRKMYTSHT